MNLASVMDELEQSLKTIPNLRTVAYNSDKVNPPTAIVSWPNPYVYDKTFGRGSDSFTIPIMLVVGRIDIRTSRNVLAAFADGSGDQSIKQAVENYEYTTCDTVRVESVEFGEVTLAGVAFLSGIFNVNVVGEGA